MKQLAIETARLHIRPLVLDDLVEFHRYRSNPEVTRYQGFDVMTLIEAETFIRDNSAKSFGKAGEWVQYAIEFKATEKLIGDCAIRLDQHDSRIAEVGITISHLEQKKGFAKEALTGIMAFLFDQQNIHRIVETVDAENQGSIALLKSTGFRQEGHFIENIFFKGKWGSEFQFALLKREWEDHKAADN
jgi:[ribosomal protein S5]-alanine N-acetyltransferase